MVTQQQDVQVDVSPIVVTEITVDGHRLVAREPIKFDVTYVDEDAMPFYVAEGPLNILTYAETRELLIDVLTEDLEIFWRDFAVGDQSNLTKGAQRLGEEMRQAFVEAVDAS